MGSNPDPKKKSRFEKRANFYTASNFLVTTACETRIAGRFYTARADSTRPRFLMRLISKMEVPFTKRNTIIKKAKQTPKLHPFFSYLVFFTVTTQPTVGSFGKSGRKTQPFTTRKTKQINLR